MKSGAFLCKKSHQPTRRGSYRWSEPGANDGVLPEFSSGKYRRPEHYIAAASEFESENGQYLKVYHAQRMCSW